jgi:hypothetical protein
MQIHEFVAYYVPNSRVSLLSIQNYIGKVRIGSDQYGPTYVLDPKLQDGKKLPRWNPRSKLGQFLGRSTLHASSIGLIRNLRTGAVSPQFHVVYDDHFTTVGADVTGDNLPVPTGFNNLMTFQEKISLKTQMKSLNKPLHSKK